MEDVTSSAILAILFFLVAIYEVITLFSGPKGGFGAGYYRSTQGGLRTTGGKVWFWIFPVIALVIAIVPGIMLLISRVIIFRRSKTSSV